jgi:hypothetical protein
MVVADVDRSVRLNWVKGISKKASEASGLVKAMATSAYTWIQDAPFQTTRGQHHHHVGIENALLGDEAPTIGARVHLEHEFQNTSAKMSCQVLCDRVVACGQPGMTANDKQEKIAVLKSVFATLQSNQIGPAMNYSPAGDKTTGGTPLYLAAKLNMPAAADFFLDHGASMVRRDPDSGMSPLEVAEACQSSSVLDMFVDRVSKLENSAKKLSSLSIERDQHPNKRRRCQRMDMGEVP